MLLDTLATWTGSLKANSSLFCSQELLAGSLASPPSATTDNNRTCKDGPTSSLIGQMYTSCPTCPQPVETSLLSNLKYFCHPRKEIINSHSHVSPLSSREPLANVFLWICSERFIGGIMHFVAFVTQCSPTFNDNAHLRGPETS